MNIITIIFYLTGAAANALPLFNKKPYKSLLFLFLGSLAVISHGYLLYRWIDINSGQNLTEFNLLSLAAWLNACFILILAIRKPLAYLTILIFPLAAISIFLVNAFPGNHIIQTATEPKQIMHILLSVMTFSVLSLAGLQAVTLAFQEKFLKQKYFEISYALPPIETMEKLLFQMIGVGSILLSFVLITSLYFFHNILIQQFLQKTILTFIAWFVFSLLLVGRYFFGWRGRKAVYWTLSGVGILSLIYFGSMIIMELLP